MSEANGIEKRCDGCEHFLRNGEGTNMKYGVCRRYPKTVIAKGFQEWPIVYESHKDACGEHKALPVGTVAETRHKAAPSSHGDALASVTNVRKARLQENVLQPHKKA